MEITVEQLLLEVNLGYVGIGREPDNARRLMMRISLRIGFRLIRNENLPTLLDELFETRSVAIAERKRCSERVVGIAQ